MSTPPLAASVPATASPAPGYDAAHWVKGSESRVSAISSVAPRCLKELGCPYSTLEPPECPNDVVFETYEPGVDLGGTIGRQATFRGVLRVHALSTLRGCQGCCNSAGGELWLANAATASNDVPRDGLALTDREHPQAFSCLGDESRVCCGFKADEEVLVSGTLREQQGRHVLEDAMLCKWVGGNAPRQGSSK